MDRYQELNRVHTFDPHSFSLEWEKLAIDFETAGRVAMAAGCRSRSEWYAGTNKGYAQKLSYTEVTRVPADYVRADPNERVLFCAVCCTWTKHVRLTDGWMCGCGEYVPLEERDEP